MSTGLVYDSRCMDHDTGSSHPERPARMSAIVERLKQACWNDEGEVLWDAMVHLSPRLIDERWLLTCHDQAHIDRVREACESGARAVDTNDCPICTESFELAKLSAGAALVAIDAIMAGGSESVVDESAQPITNAFCAMRPPGHHAERDKAMGFCFFANVAIAAEYFIKQYGLKRVAIVDFDVHHGNGTQHIHEDRADILFISLHEHPDHQYPGTGYVHETGVGVGKGFTVNIPLEPGGDDALYQRMFDESVIPRMHAFAPEAVIVSAGFDAAKADPLGRMQVSMAGFAWMTKQIKQIAKEHAHDRLLSCLEGGYDLDALGAGVEAHLRVLMQKD